MYLGDHTQPFEKAKRTVDELREHFSTEMSALSFGQILSDLEIEKRDFVIHVEFTNPEGEAESYDITS